MSGYHRAMAILTDTEEIVHTEDLGLREEDAAEAYFGVGHGDYSEETGFEPLYVVWAWIDGDVEASGVMVPEGMSDDEIEERWPDGPPDFGLGLEGSGPYQLRRVTHGSLWGHDVTNETYKGRYEPETGRLSVVKPPRATAQYRDVPESVMSALRRKFGNISKVYVF